MLGFATILKLLPHERKQFILHNFDRSFLTNVSDSILLHRSSEYFGIKELVHFLTGLKHLNF